MLAKSNQLSLTIKQLKFDRNNISTEKQLKLEEETVEVGQKQQLEEKKWD